MRHRILAEAARQRDVEFAGGKLKYTGGTPEVLTDSSTPIDREFYDFYRTARGHSPDTNTQPTLSSNTRFMNFYPLEDIETISPRPMLFVTGDQAHSREFSEQAFQLAAEPRQLVTIPGAGHVDLYDRTDLIPFDTLANFFTASLGAEE
jgi:fermentation-respiration switch protein FrsA (DUF1100 family)